MFVCSNEKLDDHPRTINCDDSKMTPQIFHGFPFTLSHTATLTHSPPSDRIASSEKPKQTFSDRKEKSLRENKLIKIVSWISLHRCGDECEKKFG